ncbi:MAG: hypothetical protein V4693_12480 [Pseudomonadota bacterium]
MELSKLAHADAAVCPWSQLTESAARLVRRGGKWMLEESIDRQKVVCR